MSKLYKGAYWSGFVALFLGAIFLDKHIHCISRFLAGILILSPFALSSHNIVHGGGIKPWPDGEHDVAPAKNEAEYSSIRYRPVSTCKKCGHAVIGKEVKK